MVDERARMITRGDIQLNLWLSSDVYWSGLFYNGHPILTSMIAGDC